MFSPKIVNGLLEESWDEVLAVVGAKCSLTNWIQNFGMANPLLFTAVADSSQPSGSGRTSAVTVVPFQMTPNVATQSDKAESRLEVQASTT